MSENTHFNFRHKVFSVQGSYFSAETGGIDPRFHMPMGDTVVSVPLDSLSEEFGIERDTDDRRLLEVVKNALKHVRTIRSVRDEIRIELQFWDGIVGDWEDFRARKSEPTLAQVIERTYHFLAHNYPIAQIW